MSDEANHATEQTVAVQKWLGFEPYILLTVEDIDDGDPESVRIGLEFGGGVTAEMVPALLRDAADETEAVLDAVENGS